MTSAPGPGVQGRRLALLRISGRVQGVGYRAWAERQAMVRGLEGWVRNRLDGSVEACVAGEPDWVEDFLGACRIGPRSAAVTEIATASATEELLELRPPGRPFAVLSTM